MSKRRKEGRKAQAGLAPLSIPFVRRPGVHIAALVLLAIGIYAGSLGNGFVSDDTPQIVKNPVIRDWGRVPEMFTHSVWAFEGPVRDNYYRPIHFLLYAVVYHLFGPEPGAYHLLAVLLHAAATVLVYLLARKCLAGWQAAFLAGALFAVHPIHSEAVVWAASVPDLAMTVFVLVAVHLFLRHNASPGIPAGGAIALLYLGAMLSKETGILLPLLLIGYELLFLRRTVRQLLANAWFFAVLLALSGVYIALRLHALGGFLPAQGAHLRMTPTEFFFTAGWVAGKYLSKLAVPLGPSYWHVIIDPMGGPTLPWLAGFSAWLALIGAIVILRCRQTGADVTARPSDSGSRISLFLFFIFVPILPALNLPGIGNSPFGERYLYLPSAGFVLLAAELWNLLLTWLPRRRQRLAWGAALLVLCTSSAQVIARVPAWRNDRTRLTEAIEQSPRSAHLQEELGQLLLEQGEIDAAEIHYREAIRLKPNARLHSGLGAILVDKQQYREAIRELRTAIVLDPSFALAHANLGTALTRAGESGLASTEYNEALRLEPANVQALSGLGEIEFRQDHPQQAIVLFRRAVQADESYPGGHINLGFALVRQQQYQEAVAELRRALEVAPRSPAVADIHFNLGVAYRGLNMAEPAIREFQIALRIRPDYEPARQHLLDIQRIINRAMSNPAPRPAAAR